MERLNSHLLEAVLSRLGAGEHMAAARQVSRALDAAVGAQFSCIRLTPANTRDAAQRVRLSRFPALTGLRLEGWTTAPAAGEPQDASAAFGQAELLQSCFTEGRLLWSVTTLYLGDRTLDAATLELVLSHLPGLEVISMDSKHITDTVIPPIALQASWLEHLEVRSVIIKYASTAAALARLTNMVDLQIFEVTTADAWAALPLGQLTRMRLNRLPPPPALEDLGLGRLIQLWEIKLPFSCLEALARGAPHLELLECLPQEDWGNQQPPAATVFSKVTHANFICTDLEDIITVHLPSMLPALRHCLINGVNVELKWTGLKLKSLGLDHARILPELDWDGIASLTSLTELGCVVGAASAYEEVYPQIGRLTQLRVLDLTLCAFSSGNRFDAAPALEMAARLPIHTFNIACRRWDAQGRFIFDSAALSKLVRSSPSMCTLSFEGTHAFGVGDVSVMATHPSCERLQVVCDEEDGEEVECLGRRGGREAAWRSRWWKSQLIVLLNYSRWEGGRMLRIDVDGPWHNHMYKQSENCCYGALIDSNIDRFKRCNQRILMISDQGKSHEIIPACFDTGILEWAACKGCRVLPSAARGQLPRPSTDPAPHNHRRYCCYCCYCCCHCCCCRRSALRMLMLLLALVGPACVDICSSSV
jgi:hypothetical protein